MAKARLLQLGFRSDTLTFFPGAPDLAIEVMSPGSMPREMDERLAGFFASGSQVVWIIHPTAQFVEVCHSRTDRRMVAAGGVIEGEHVLPGFRLPVSDIFKNWHAD